MKHHYILYVSYADGRTEAMSLKDGVSLSIGRHPDSDILLPNDRTRFSRNHAALECSHGSVIISFTGNPKACPVYLNENETVTSDGNPVRLGDRITIDKTILVLQQGESVQSEAVHDYEPITISRPVSESGPVPKQSTTARPKTESVSDSTPTVKSDVWEYDVRKLAEPHLFNIHLFDKECIDLIRNVHISIINELLNKGILSGKNGEIMLKELQHNDATSVKLNEAVEELIDDHVDRVTDILPYGTEPDGTEWKVTREQFKRALHDDIREKMGALTPLLKTEEITEVMINRYDEVFVEARGLLYHTPFRYFDEDQLRMIIDGIVASVHRQVNNNSPMVDARLPDGSRVNAVIPPLALKGASVTIRKFPQKRLHIEDLIEKDTMSKQEAAFLKACVRARKNILVSGGTGSGKTTLLNVLSSFIHDRERVVTIEDSAELKLDQRNIVRLESRPANAEKEGKVTIRDLVINALRMRPDRIVVGECRGAEALDMLQAMNTGHDGSLTTCHANSAVDSLMRLENMVLMAGYDLPSKAIKDQIAAALDLVVQLSRMPDGSRKVTEIIEITKREEDVILHTPVFKYDYDKKCHQATGIRPSFVKMQMEVGGTGIFLGDESMSELVEFPEDGQGIVLVNPRIFQVE